MADGDSMTLEADPIHLGVMVNAKIVTARRFDGSGFEVRQIDGWTVVKASARHGSHIWITSDCVLLGEATTGGYELSLVSADASETLWRTSLVTTAGVGLRSHYRLGWMTRNDDTGRRRQVAAAPEVSDRTIVVWGETSSGSEWLVGLNRADGAPCWDIEVRGLVSVWSTGDRVVLFEGFGGGDRVVRVVEESSNSAVWQRHIGRPSNVVVVGHMVGTTRPNSLGGEISLLDASTGTEVREIRCAADSPILALQDVSLIAYNDRAGSVRVAGLDRDEVVAQGRLVFGNSKVVVVEDERRCLVGYRTGDGVAVWEHDGPVAAVEMHSHLAGEQRLVMRQDSALSWLDAATGQTLLVGEAGDTVGRLEATSDTVAVVESPMGFRAVRGRVSTSASLANAVRQLARQRQAELSKPNAGQIGTRGD